MNGPLKEQNWTWMKTSCLWGFSKSWKTCCFYWKDFYLITSRVCLVSTKTQVSAARSSAFRGLFTLNRTQANKGVKSSVHEERLPLACKGRIESRALDAKTWSFRSQPKLAMFEKAWWFHCSRWKVPLATLHWPCPERVARGVPVSRRVHVGTHWWRQECEGTTAQ